MNAYDLPDLTRDINDGELGLALEQVVLGGVSWALERGDVNRRALAALLRLGLAFREPETGIYCITILGQQKYQERLIYQRQVAAYPYAP